MFFGYLVSSSLVEDRKVGIWLFLAENLIFAFPSTYFLVDIKMRHDKQLNNFTSV